MRESLASAINSKNLQQKESSCSLDSVHALGIASIESQIGVSAIHVIDGLQPQEYNNLIYSLLRKASKKLKCDKNILLRVCKQVIYESAITCCPDCKGRKHELIDKKVVICPTCKGIGLKRYTDLQRAHSIKISLEEYVKHWASRFFEVQAIFTNEQRNALHIVRNRKVD